MKLSWSIRNHHDLEHKPDDPIEKFRITSNGATVSKQIWQILYYIIGRKFSLNLYLEL